MYICSMDMNTQNGPGHAAWSWTMDLHECRNADKKFSPASSVFHYHDNGSKKLIV